LRLTCAGVLVSAVLGFAPPALAHYPWSESRCTREHPGIASDNVDVAVAGVSFPYPPERGTGAWVHRTWVYAWPDGNVEANGGGPLEGTDARVHPQDGACATVAGTAVEPPRAGLPVPYAAGSVGAYVYFEDSTLLSGDLTQRVCVGGQHCGTAVVVADPVTGVARLFGEIAASDGTSDVYRFDVTISGEQRSESVTGIEVYWRSLPRPLPDRPALWPECVRAQPRGGIERRGPASGHLRRYDGNGALVSDAGAPGPGTILAGASASVPRWC
jgi:hypothetical protein